MMMPDASREALLDKENATLRAVIKAQSEEIEQLKQHNHTLRLKVDAMARKLFGKSSEPERSGDRQPRAARRA